MQIKRTDVEQKVITFLAGCHPALEADKMRGEDELVALGIESLDVIEMLFEIEDTYGVEIPDEVVQSFKTIDDVIGYIVAHYGERVSEVARS